MRADSNSTSGVQWAPAQHTRLRDVNRSIADLVAPLDQVAARSASLIANHGATFMSGDERYELPRYLFVGPK